MREQIQGQYRKSQTDNRHLRGIANTDPLTGAFNRRALMNRLEAIEASAALVLIEVDHFKSINDNYGHQVGDAILVELVRILRESVRKQDFVARIGGEESVVFLPGTEREEELSLVRRLHSGVSGRDLSIGEYHVHLAVSIGVAMVPAPGVDSRHDVLNATDNVLYEAKRSGRNRIYVC